MPEILTESFCERCGTRYTFESAAPRKTRRLGQIKTLSKGMKNWVMSDDTSLDEAMAAARNDDERELTSQQLDAFHATFNFCMTCRQYTCGNCWNTAESRCLTCAPHLGHEILPGAFPDRPAAEPIRLEAEAWPDVDLSAAANGNGHDPDLTPAGADPWAIVGATDVEEIPDFDPAARLAFLSGETVAPTVEPEVAAALDEPEPAERAQPVAAFEAEPVAFEAASAEDVAATSEPDLAVAADEPADGEAALADPWTVPELASAAPDELAQPEVAASADELAQPEVAASAEPVEPPADELAPAPAARSARPDLEPLPATVEGKADVGAARTADLLRRFRPGQNIDAELAAYEAEQARAAMEPATDAAEPPAPKPAPRPSLTWAPAEPPTPTPIIETPEPVEPAPIAAEALESAEAPTALPIAADAAEPVEALEPAATAAELVEAPTPMPVAEQAPEPVAAEAPEPVAPEPTPEVPAAPAPVAAEPPRDDRILQPTWQIYAPDATPTIGRPLDAPAPIVPPVPPAPPAASGPPQWPAQPDQIESPAMALFANRAARSTSDGLWAASAQEVLAPTASVAPAGVQPCSSCGLSLSATARFCRRCGTRQG